jgi:hypothetical protein
MRVIRKSKISSCHRYYSLHVIEKIIVGEMHTKIFLQVLFFQYFCIITKKTLFLSIISGFFFSFRWLIVLVFLIVLKKQNKIKK